MSLGITIWNYKETPIFIIKISIIFNKIKLNYLFLYTLFLFVTFLFQLKFHISILIKIYNINLLFSMKF